MTHRGPCWRFKTAVERGISIWLLSVGALSVATAQESPSFKMKRLTVTALAERLTSPNHINIIAASEVIGAAGACPAGVATHLGFWSVLGPAEVPVLLTVDKIPPNQNIELSWSGQAASFEVFRSMSPVAVEAPENLLVTSSSCSATDTTAPGVAFYLVRPIPDGPNTSPVTP